MNHYMKRERRHHFDSSGVLFQLRRNTGSSDYGMRDDKTDFINALADMEGVNNAVVVSYNGDYMG